MAGITTQFDPPAGQIEAIYLMEALWKEGKHDRLRALLAEPIVAESEDPSVIDLKKKYTARLAK